MRSNLIINIILSIVVLCLFGCGSNSINAGESILSDEDKILVKSDTFGVVSSLSSSASVALRPDSFLLGECETNFGVIQADILTQLACPEGFEYPDELVLASGDTLDLNPMVDSVCLYLYYDTWYGDGFSPIGISVYEMDRSTLSDNQLYYSDMELSDYCSLDKSCMVSSYSSIVVPNSPSDSSYSSVNERYVPTICIKLSDEFAHRFFQIKDFSTQKSFNDQFKGLYICSDFGGGNVLYVKDITMTVFYHFTMHRPNVVDSIVYDTKSFYANKEVRQVNRYLYPNREDVLRHYSLVSDTNYIVSPANISTRLSVKLDSIFNRVEDQFGDDASLYRVYVNKALLTLDVLYSDSLTGRPRDNWEIPASNMMLIKEDQLETFFATSTLPSDTSAIIASLVSQTDSLGNVSYSYNYDLSALLTEQLRNHHHGSELVFVLVPVTVGLNSSGAIISVNQLQTVSATRIRSANNEVSPMDIEMVYCGFNRLR